MNVDLADFITTIDTLITTKNEQLIDRAAELGLPPRDPRLIRDPLYREYMGFRDGLVFAKLAAKGCVVFSDQRSCAS